MKHVLKESHIMDSYFSNKKNKNITIQLHLQYCYFQYLL